MRTLPEFFQGSITQDLHGILDAEPWREAASGELAAKAKKPAKTGAPCKDHPKTPGTTCTPGKLPCKGKGKASCKPICNTEPTAGVTCGTACSGKKPCKPPKKKAAAFLPDVEGWSTPPAPPAF
jgi:hypothetical protein